MPISNLFRFAKKKPVKPGASEPAVAGRSGALYQETNIYGLMEYMTNMPDLDMTLQQAGIMRKDLKRLETDDEISAALETRLLGVMATPYRFESDDEASLEFVQEQVQPCMDDILRQVWQAIPYGYSVIEAVYKHMEGNRIGIDRLLNKPFYWFQPQPDGTLTPFGLFEDILDTKFKFFMTRRNPTFVMPYGEALLSRLYWPWFFRSMGWEHWMRWLARYGTPPLIGEGNANQLDKLRDALVGAVDAAVLAVPEGTNVTVANAQTGAGHFPEFETAVTKRIQKLILGQTLTTDVGKTGSFAAAKVHDGVRDDKRLSDAKLITRTVQNMVDALVLLNGLKPVTFVMEDERKLNEDRANRDAELANAGIVSFTEDYLLRAYDFEKGDFEVGGNAPDSMPNAPKKGVKAALVGDMWQFSDAKQRFTPAQEEIEQLGDDVVNGSPSPISDDAIKMAIKSSANAEEMMDKLATLAENYSPGAFAELTERALFAADVFGYVKSEQGKH